jgi:hypothetical protein
MWTSLALGMHSKPVAVLDPDGLYDPLWPWLDLLTDRGFVRQRALTCCIARARWMRHSPR